VSDLSITPTTQGVHELNVSKKTGGGGADKYILQP
jgi:hypothetical protein